MGKFANLEIIPLDNSPPVNSRGQNIPPGGMSAPFISDKTIIPRVQKYLENNENQTYVDITTMADDLQKLYKDYGRRKRGPFRSSVKKAYNAILQNFGHSQDNLSSSEEFSDESVPGSNFENSMNNQFMDMYKRNSQTMHQENEPPIDISSDDSNDTPAFPLTHEKTSNGASTSNKPETVVIAPRVLNAPEVKPAIDFPPQDSSESSNRRGKKRKINQIPPMPSNGSKKHKTGVGAVTKSTVTFKDIGGLNNILLEISYVILMEKDKHVEDINGDSPAVMLLHGPTGCGKTLLARAIAGEWKIPLLEIQANDLIGGISGESEERIKSTFNEAAALAPCVLFIDGIDTVFQNRKLAQKKMESRIVTQLLTSIDSLIQKAQEENVILIGAANSIDLIDPAILTRFYNKFSLGLPNEEARIAILKVLTKNYTSLSPNFDYQKIACCTPGFSGADLLCLLKKGVMLVNKRVYNYILKEQYSSTNVPKVLLPKPAVIEENSTDLETKSDQHNNVDHENSTEVDVVEPQSTNEVVVIDDDNKVDEIGNAAKAEIYLQNLHKNSEVLLQELLNIHFSGKKYAIDNSISVLTTEDILNSVKSITPACKSEGFATVPDVTWDDIGSLANIREELQFSILGPLKYPTYSQGEESSGVLLCGPPGCGKTLLAKAIANEARINFLSVNGPELLSMYVGESERAVRNCFEKAQNSAPCIIFFDEIDSLCPHRSQNEHDKVTDRVVNQMLTEMDGVKGKRDGVFLLAATNRLDRLDRALLRPGRFSEIIYVPIPTPNDRVNILRTITKIPLAPDVDLDVIARLDKCDGFTGADLKQLIKMAKRFALKASVLEGTAQEAITLTMEHFNKALLRVKPSVSKEDQEKYEKFRKVYTLPNIDGDEEMELS